MSDYFDNSGTMGGVNWPSVQTWESGCSPDEKTFFSGNIYRPICVAKNASDAWISQNIRALEDAYIARIGGLGEWSASTAPVIVSGGGDPAYHGQYDYAGHFWGVPFYRNGDRYILYSGTWQLVDANLAYPVYSGSGAAAYPYEVTDWIAAFGTVSNVPTFSRGSGGSSVAIPRWPAIDPPPPGPLPWQSGWYQQAYVYEPTATYVAWTDPYNPDPIDAYYGTPPSGNVLDLTNMPGRYLYDEFGNMIAATNAIGGDYGSTRPAPGSPTYVDVVDDAGNPIQYLGPPVRDTSGGTKTDVVTDIQERITNAIGGFSPLTLAVVAIAAVWLFSGKK